MTALNFPDPASTTTYDPGNGVVYTWNAGYGVWQIESTSSSSPPTQDLIPDWDTAGWPADHPGIPGYGFEIANRAIYLPDARFPYQREFGYNGLYGDTSSRGKKTFSNPLAVGTAITAEYKEIIEHGGIYWRGGGGSTEKQTLLFISPGDLRNKTVTIRWYNSTTTMNDATFQCKVGSNHETIHFPAYSWGVARNVVTEHAFAFGDAEDPVLYFEITFGMTAAVDFTIVSYTVT